VHLAVTIVLTLLAGVLTGILSGMFGIGGAVVSTPALRALGATPLESVGSTLPSIFPSAVAGVLRYQREGLVRWSIVAWVATVGAAASVGGSLLSDVVPGGGHVLMLLTAALVAYTAYRTGRPRPVQRAVVGEPIVVSGGATEPPLRDRPWRLAVIGLAAGGLSGLLGVGGGIVMVPAYSQWVRLGLKESVATSLACVGILAVPGTVTHALLGHIDWTYALPLCVGVVPGARLGAHLAIRASERTLRLAVGLALGAIACVYATGEVLALVH